MVWIEPIIDRDAMTITHAIHEGGEQAYERATGEQAELALPCWYISGGWED